MTAALHQCGAAHHPDAPRECTGPDLDSRRRRQGSPGNAVAERLTLQELDDHERSAPVGAHIEDRDDVGVGERRQHLRLALEAGQDVWRRPALDKRPSNMVI